MCFVLVPIQFLHLGRSLEGPVSYQCEFNLISGDEPDHAFKIRVMHRKVEIGRSISGAFQAHSGSRHSHFRVSLVCVRFQKYWVRICCYNFFVVRLEVCKKYAKLPLKTIEANFALERKQNQNIFLRELLIFVCCFKASAGAIKKSPSDERSKASEYNHLY